MRNTIAVIASILVGVGLILAGVVIVNQLQPAPTTTTDTDGQITGTGSDTGIDTTDTGTSTGTGTGAGTTGGTGGSLAPTDAAAGEDRLAICGESCETDSDCATATTGAATVCYQGTCQAAECPGQTQFGTRCDCNVLNACGAPCSEAVGLCAGNNACRYISSSCPANPDVDNPTTTFCLPRSLGGGYTTRNCTTRDTANSFVASPDGSAITATIIRQLCDGTIPNPTTAPTAELPRTDLSTGDLTLILGLVLALIGAVIWWRYYLGHTSSEIHGKGEVNAN